MEVIRGASPRPKGDPKYFGGCIPWIMISDVTREKGKYLSQTRDHVTEEGAKKSRFLKAGTLILSNSGTVCVPKVLAVDGCIHDGFVAFPEIPEQFDIFYLYYFFEHIRPRVIHVHRQGITQVNLNTNIVKNIELPAPPRHEQQDIVAEIERQFSRLDEAVASLKRTKGNLKRYKASVLKAAVEGKLTEDWRKQHPNVERAGKLLERILAERRAKYGRTKDGFLAAEGDAPAEPPDGWAICSIDQIAECLDSKRVPVNKAERTKRSGSVPYYGANGQVGVIDDYIFDEPLVLVVEDETFTGRTQAFSYMIRGKSWVNNHAHVLRATSAITNSYLNYGLAHYPFTPRTTGSTGRRKLTQRGLMTAPFLLPPLVEQEQIVTEVERRLSVIDELEATIEANLNRADRLRQSILSQAFAGNLVCVNANREGR
ncbi:MAG: restriction endonuclease subunit S [Nitrospira sp.]|nr:restriction endonuclease subunit S [Nitrospira sp.]